jgi:hypothetical protein
MSYIQIEIGPGGGKRGLKFNQLAVELYTKKTDWVNHTDASEVYATFYAGLMGNCAAKEQEPDFTFEDVQDWVDDLSVDTKKEVMKVFEESKKFQEWMARVKDRLAETPAEGEPLKKNETLTDTTLTSTNLPLAS